MKLCQCENILGKMACDKELSLSLHSTGASCEGQVLPLHYFPCLAFLAVKTQCSSLRWMPCRNAHFWTNFFHCRNTKWFEEHLIWTRTQIPLSSSLEEQLELGSLGHFTQIDITGAFEHKEHTILLFCWKPAAKDLSRLPQQPRKPNSFSNKGGE